MIFAIYSCKGKNLTFFWGGGAMSPAGYERVRESTVGLYMQNLPFSTLMVAVAISLVLIAPTHGGMARLS